MARLANWGSFQLLALHGLALWIRFSTSLLSLHVGRPKRMRKSNILPPLSRSVQISILFSWVAFNGGYRLTSSGELMLAWFCQDFGPIASTLVTSSDQGWLIRNQSRFWTYMEAGNGSASAHHRAGPLEIKGHVEDMFWNSPEKWMTV